MRLLLGLGRRSRNQIVYHADFEGVEQVHHDTRRTARLLREPDETQTSTRAPSATRSADRRAGRAMRLLLQRTDHQRSGVVIQESAAHRSADPDGHERALVPVWHIPAYSAGDSTGLEED